MAKRSNSFHYLSPIRDAGNYRSAPAISAAN
jgi:hypothetical protein